MWNLEFVTIRDDASECGPALLLTTRVGRPMELPRLLMAQLFAHHATRNTSVPPANMTRPCRLRIEPLARGSRNVFIYQTNALQQQQQQQLTEIQRSSRSIHCVIVSRLQGPVFGA